MQLQDLQLQNRWELTAVSKKKVVGSLPKEVATEQPVIVKNKSTSSKQSPARSRKKAVSDAPEENLDLSMKNDITAMEVNIPSVLSEDSKKISRGTRSIGKFSVFPCKPFMLALDSALLTREKLVTS